jgi:hypothetical protein
MTANGRMRVLFGLVDLYNDLHGCAPRILVVEGVRDFLSGITIRVYWHGPNFGLVSAGIIALRSAPLLVASPISAVSPR